MTLDAKLQNYVVGFDNDFLKCQHAINQTYQYNNDGMILMIAKNHLKQSFIFPQSQTLGIC